MRSVRYVLGAPWYPGGTQVVPPLLVVALGQWLCGRVPVRALSPRRVQWLCASYLLRPEMASYGRPYAPPAMPAPPRPKLALGRYPRPRYLRAARAGAVWRPRAARTDGKDGCAVAVRCCRSALLCVGCWPLSEPVLVQCSAVQCCGVESEYVRRKGGRRPVGPVSLFIGSRNLFARRTRTRG